MKEGKKPSEWNGYPISPSDYVIDFLRCTIEASIWLEDVRTS